MDITSKLLPYSRSAFNSFIPIANIVGNIIDIKKQISIIVYMAIIPVAYIANAERKILVIAYNPNSR